VGLKEDIEQESGAGDYFVNDDGSMDRIVPIPAAVRAYAVKHGIPLKPDHIPAPGLTELEEHFNAAPKTDQIQDSSGAFATNELEALDPKNHDPVCVCNTCQNDRLAKRTGDKKSPGYLIKKWL
jgi:hypothetical protein